MHAEALRGIMVLNMGRWEVGVVGAEAGDPIDPHRL
jgi:hypothetical protein